MTPEKIYIAHEYSEIDVLPPGVTQKQVFSKDVCYIRKDALLEWVRLAYGKLSMNPFDVQDVFEELIDKLNEM